MEPRIQYAKTSDGVSIAYWKIGDGPPLVYMPRPGIGHIQMEWQIPEIRRWYEQLAAAVTVVRYDGRGTGLSERNVTDFSIEAQVSDIQAVADSLVIDTFALLGISLTGPVAIAYAAQHPERLSHLIVWCSAPRGSGILGSQQARALGTLLGTDWELYTETLAHVVLGWSEAEARRFAAFMREGVTQETYQRALASFARFDVTELLPQLRVPTLVIHRRQVLVPAIEFASEMASAVPGAGLAVLEGNSVMPYQGDVTSVADAIMEFLGASEGASEPLPSGTAVILFADIADSTALTERLGDTSFRDRARDLDAALRAAIRENNGAPVEGKLLGDGVLALFTSARQAIEAALRCAAAGSHGGLPLHLGIHAGDVIREENNVYGGAVNIASRISGLSAPGEVLVSETVRSLARTSAGVAFEDRGEQSLKGVGEPVRVWALREGG